MATSPLNIPSLQQFQTQNIGNPLYNDYGDVVSAYSQQYPNEYYQYRSPITPQIADPESGQITQQGGGGEWKTPPAGTTFQSVLNNLFRTQGPGALSSLGTMANQGYLKQFPDYNPKTFGPWLASRQAEQEQNALGINNLGIDDFWMASVLAGPVLGWLGGAGTGGTGGAAAGGTSAMSAGEPWLAGAGTSGAGATTGATTAAAGYGSYTPTSIDVPSATSGSGMIPTSSSIGNTAMTEFPAAGPGVSSTAPAGVQGTEYGLGEALGGMASPEAVAGGAQIAQPASSGFQLGNLFNDIGKTLAFTDKPGAFPWSNVIGGGLELYGRRQDRKAQQAMQNQALDRQDQLMKDYINSDQWRRQQPRYFKPAYEAATQGIGDTPYGQSILKQVMAQEAARGFSQSPRMLQEAAKALNLGTTDYMNAIAPFATGRAPSSGPFDSAIGSAMNMRAPSKLGEWGALGNLFRDIMRSRSGESGGGSSENVAQRRKNPLEQLFALV